MIFFHSNTKRILKYLFWCLHIFYKIRRNKTISIMHFTELNQRGVSPSMSTQNSGSKLGRNHVTCTHTYFLYPRMIILDFHWKWHNVIVHSHPVDDTIMIPPLWKVKTASHHPMMSLYFSFVCLFLTEGEHIGICLCKFYQKWWW